MHITHSGTNWDQQAQFYGEKDPGPHLRGSDFRWGAELSAQLEGCLDSIFSRLSFAFELPLDRVALPQVQELALTNRFLLFLVESWHFLHVVKDLALVLQVIQADKEA